MGKNNTKVWEKTRENRYAMPGHSVSRFIPESEDFLGKIGWVEKERQRIARELHDGLGQLLSGLKMKLAVEKKNLKDSSYWELMEIVESTIMEYRAISQNLVSPYLIRYGLECAMGKLCEDLNQNDGPRINFSSHGLSKLPKPLEIPIFRIIQELLNNACRHSLASSIDIEISMHRNEFKLSIADNGKGFDAQKFMSENMDGIGLRNISERVREMKGTFIISSKVGQGTVATVTLKTKPYAKAQVPDC
jgi:two-component system NarL family sensor kinase